MTAPALAAERFALACLMGLGLGAVYGFLRPLRPKHTALSDGLFLLAAVGVWVYLSFGICRGDLRLAYSAGLAAGGIIWEWTLGRPLRRIFSAFWKGIGNLLEVILLPAKKISQIIKILFASVEKWVTIKWRNRRHHRPVSGGLPNGRTKRIFRADQAGSPAQQQSEQDRGDRHHRIVYGRPVHPASGHDQN